jgi:hypothetical protein
MRGESYFSPYGREAFIPGMDYTLIKFSKVFLLK